MPLQDFEPSAKRILRKTYPSLTTDEKRLERRLNALTALHSSILNSEIGQERVLRGNCDTCYGRGYVITSDLVIREFGATKTKNANYCKCRRGASLKAVVEDGLL